MVPEDTLTRWANIARIAGAVIALAVLVLGGGFVYNELWHVSDVRYTVLPTYDVEAMAFSGLVVENRGRVPARNVDIILTSLEHEIQALHMPGPHEKVNITDGGINKNNATIEMERLSPGSSLSIYLITSAPVTLVKGNTFIIASDRGTARPSSEADLRVSLISGITGLIASLMAGLTATFVSRRGMLSAERKPKGRKSQDKGR